MFRILAKESLAPKITKFIIAAPAIAEKAKPGHFIIVRVGEKSERIPLTIADYDREQGRIMIVVQAVGFSTREISQLEVGDQFRDLVGPLGQPFASQDYKRVVAVAGGLGAAPLYPKLKEISQRGGEVTTILGAQTGEQLILETELAELSRRLHLATDDGSRGQQGFVTDILADLLEEDSGLELVIAVGPMVMMEAVSELTAEYGIKTLVSLNSIMVDGTGMCGGCRVTVGGETKFACVDGPIFDGHQVDFAEQRQRKEFYAAQEDQLGDHIGGEHQCQNHQKRDK